MINQEKLFAMQTKDSESQQMDKKQTNNLTEKKAQKYEQLSKGIKTVLQQTCKRYSTPLIREMQIKTTVSHFFIFQKDKDQKA